MTTSEYVRYLFQKQATTEKIIDEAAVYEAASLASGSFLYKLYEMLWLNDLDMESLTDHLESLYDRKEYHGFLYLLVILAESVSVTLPAQFYEFSSRELAIPILSAAIIEDWLDIDGELEEIAE
jgi:hypothetical protein